jgi:uncharacterized membrane protein YeaQ/YmgE (transglycosylase-associated protein family)
MRSGLGTRTCTSVGCIRPLVGPPGPAYERMTRGDVVIAHTYERQVSAVGIISWIILGLLAGAIAKILLPGRDPGGLIGTTIIGIIGSFLGGWISSTFLHRSVNKEFFDGALWLSAIGGSLVLLILYRIFFGNSRER